MLPPISNEQREIVAHFCAGKNVIVNSVAGSGKTTCNLYVAQALREKNILLLTYNARLKQETREKVQSCEIENLAVHSYHSFCVHNYDREGYDNNVLKKIVETNVAPIDAFSYDLIILDEAQDITPTFYQLIRKIFRDNGVVAQIGVFGDRRQSIYDFMGSDERYIVYASKLFNFTNTEWVECCLSESFRITDKMAKFINCCMLKQECIISRKVSEFKPRYVIGSYDEPYSEVCRYLGMGYLPSDIFILAPSTRTKANTTSFGQSPLVHLENKIKHKHSNINVFVSTNDDMPLDERLINGKLVFSTYNQSKGLERKVVILFNFDETYFKFYARDAIPLICPNILYVGATRALEHLTVIHGNNNEIIPFLEKRNIRQYCDFDPYKKNKSKMKKHDNIMFPAVAVVDVVRYLPPHVLQNCVKMLNIIPLDPAGEKIIVSSTTDNSITVENISDLTGTAIPAKFQATIVGNIGILDRMKKIREQIRLCLIEYPTIPLNIGDKILYEQNQLDDATGDTVNELLYIANCWNAYTNGYVFRVFQISDYGWLTEKCMEQCLQRLRELNISKNATFEYDLFVDDRNELCGRSIVGRADCIDANVLYEFKGTNKLEDAHIIQLALYAYMYETEHKKKLTYILFNILTNERIEIKCEYSKLVEMVNYLMRAKYCKKIPITDDEFIAMNML